MHFRSLNDSAEGEVSQVTQLQEEWVNSGLLPDTFNKICRDQFDKSNTVVAESKSMIVGYAVFFEKSDHFELDSIYFQQNREYKGQGRKLLKYTEEKIKALGGAKIVLCPKTSKNIEKLIKYYENCGYDLNGELMEKII